MITQQQLGLHSDSALESLQRGENAEKVFHRVIRKANHHAYESNSFQDRVEHWDFEVEGAIINGTVEVKSRKKISRSQPEPQDKLFWVEIRNIGGGQGWLYGKADFIAFEILDGFVLIKREKLIASLKGKLQRGIVNDPNQAVYHVYQRFDRLDWVTLVPQKDILPHAFAIISKSGVVNLI